VSFCQLNLQNHKCKMTIMHTDNLYQDVTKQDEQYFDEYMLQKCCPQCGKDHRFKPRFSDVKSSIHDASKLIALFFKEDLGKGEWSYI
jgi:hypothetical protein